MTAPRLITAALTLAIGALVGVTLVAVSAAGAQAETRPGVVVIAIPRGTFSPNKAVRIERDLRNMVQAARDEGNADLPPVFPIEPRYDVGNMNKGNLNKSLRQFNDAQRKLEQGDPEEALEHLFRAERFYNKGIPFVSDTSLLRGIFYYYYLARTEAKQTKKAVEAYCAYVALTRNLAGSAGSIDQFPPLADRCEATPINGTAELRVTANVDGAHVFVDERPVGVVGRDVPYGNPFIAAGPHLVEVRKAGYARWGTLVTLSQGNTKELKAKLKKARNRAEDFAPMADLILEGPDAVSQDYLGDMFFELTERFGVTQIILAYADKPAKGPVKLTILTADDGGVETQTMTFVDDIDGHRPALMKYWKARFGEALDPADAIPVINSWAPTLFKVE